MWCERGRIGMTMRGTVTVAMALMIVLLGLLLLSCNIDLDWLCMRNRTSLPEAVFCKSMRCLAIALQTSLEDSGRVNTGLHRDVWHSHRMSHGNFKLKWTLPTCSACPRTTPTTSIGTPCMQYRVHACNRLRTMHNADLAAYTIPMQIQ